MALDSRTPGIQPVRQRLPDAAAEILHHKAPYARTRVEHCKYKKRFEHNGEVVPDAEEAFASDGVGEDLSHAHGKRRCAASAIPKRQFANLMGEIGHGLRLQRIPQPLIVAAAHSGAADNTGRAVDREIDSRRHRARGDHGHHADKRLQQHRAIAMKRAWLSRRIIFGVVPERSANGIR